MAASISAERDGRAAVPGGSAPSALQLKIRLLSISPMIWRRVLMPETMRLRELHGVIQVAMGWKSLHLFVFERGGGRYGSRELSAASPDVALTSFRLRGGAKLIYRYDMTDGWAHEVRVEERLDPPPGKPLPVCVAGAGACPPEECGGPSGYLARRDEACGLDAYLDAALIVEVAQDIVDGTVPTALTDPIERVELEDAVDRMRARQALLDTGFSRRAVNQALLAEAHLDRMHQWI